MDNIPEFDDAESLFVNWKDDDNSGCSNNAVAGAGGPSSLSKETSHISSNDWNDILDAADEQPSKNGASSAEDSSSKRRSNKVDNKVSASSSENTTSSATANTAITSDVKSKSNDNNGGNSSSSNSLQFSIDGGDETTTNFGDSSSSSNNNNNFTFPMYYQMNQGHIHPLAMTSMASCPPYNVNAPSEAPQNAATATTSVESAGLQSLMQQQQQQQAAIQPAAQQQQQQVQSHINNTTSATTTNNSTFYNSPYADHLRELTANFRNNPSTTTTSMDASQAHYGMAVNGFHPQVNAQVNHVLPLSGNYGGMIGNSGVAVTRLPTSTTTTNQAAKTLTAAESYGTIKTSNKKSKGGVSSGRKRNASATTATTSMNAATDSNQHARNSRERNEREQVRAQKITQLISELRVNMQQGGWQEEMKSKYQTLSQ